MPFAAGRTMPPFLFSHHSTPPTPLPLGRHTTGAGWPCRSALTPLTTTRGRVGCSAPYLWPGANTRRHVTQHGRRSREISLGAGGPQSGVLCSTGDQRKRGCHRDAGFPFNSLKRMRRPCPLQVTWSAEVVTRREKRRKMAAARRRWP